MPDYAALLGRYDYAELRLESSHHTIIRCINDEVKANTGTQYGMSARVLENGSWGFASSGNGCDPAKLLDNAHELSKLEKGSIKVKKPGRVIDDQGTDSDKTSEEEIIKALIEANKAMVSNKVISRSSVCSDETIKTEYYNSEGSEIIQNMQYTYASCTAIAKDGSIIQRGSERRSSREGFGVLDMNIPALEARKKAERLLGAESPPQGNFTVILDPEMTGVFSHEAVGHASEADSILDGESILANKKGERIGSELVTITDDPSANDFGYYEYDEEGVKGEEVTLIDKGTVLGFLNSRETSHALDISANGHARASGYDSVPIVRMSNTYLSPGTSSIDDVFDVKEGVYLRGMRGGSVDTFSGGFMFKAEEASRVENGECTQNLRDVTISGNILETLMNVEAVGRDFKTSPGMCGKFGQEAPVSDGGPHIRLKDMRIG